MRDTKPITTKSDKSLISIAGEYAVASELCRRGVYAQLTLGNRKKVDLLIDGEKGFARVEVKSKQGKMWPGVKGIAPGDGPRFLVLVDLQDKGPDEKPEFYVISKDEWLPFLKQHLGDKLKSKAVKIDVDGVPHFGNSFSGTGIRTNEVAQFKDRWDKIVRMVGTAKA